MYKEFEEFYLERLNRRPWDFDHNPVGFGPEHPGYSDISAHMPIIKYFSSQIKNAVEFGARDGSSASAILVGGANLHSYDHIPTDSMRYLEMLNKERKLPANFTFHHANTLECNIEPTDLALFDSLHTFSHLEKEIKRHIDKVARFALFHDSYSHAKNSLDISGEEGITRAIEENMVGWKLVYDVKFNHGLQVYERKQ